MAAVDPMPGDTAIRTYEVSHLTRYEYEDPVTMSQHLLHLIPRPGAYQQCLDDRLEIAPEPDETSSGIDWFGNETRIVAINRPHAAFTVTARATVQLLPRPALAALCSPPWEAVVDTLHAFGPNAPHHAQQFLFESPHVPLFEQLHRYAQPSFGDGRSMLEATMDLTRRIHADFRFDPRATDLSTPLAEVMELRRGVCQDFAHVMIGCLRSVGLAARYMSGYIMTRRAGTDITNVGADASHAWISAYCPGHDWVDFDPTNCCLVDREHITVAWGRDFSDVTPVRGVVLGGGGQDPEVEVSVRLLD